MAMSRKWFALALTAGGIAGLGLIPGRAEDEVKSPLAKVMVKIDDHTKSVGAICSSTSKFKSAGNGKEIIPAAEALIELGKETRKFPPPEAAKQPLAKWKAMTEEYITASQVLDKAAKKGNLPDIRKAFKSLNNTCSNCHGAFRPKAGDDF
jgi:cytochrome c556